MDARTLAELLRETAEHHDHYEKTRRVWQKISCIMRCCAVKKTLISRGSSLFHLPRNHRAALQIAFWCINGIFRVWLERV